MTKENRQRSNDKFTEFISLCDIDPERALYESAKSVVGNHCKSCIVDTDSESDWDKKHAEWAGDHGLYNLALAVEAYMKQKKIKENLS